MINNIAIIHYNTPAMTAALVRSIRKCCSGVSITVFDNSDQVPFPHNMGVRIIDNTRGQVIDFKEMIARYPWKLPTINNYASAKHIASVDRLFDLLPGGFLLLDSDTLVKKDLEPFFDQGVPWAGALDTEHNIQSWHRPRLAPYCLWINVPMCRQLGIRFMSEGRIDVLSCTGKPYYDTAASFWEDCFNSGLMGKEIDIYEYIEHFGGASYKNNTAASHIWLDQHKELYR